MKNFKMTMGAKWVATGVMVICVLVFALGLCIGTKNGKVEEQFSSEEIEMVQRLQQTEDLKGTGMTVYCYHDKYGKFWIGYKPATVED